MAATLLEFLQNGPDFSSFQASLSDLRNMGNIYSYVSRTHGVYFDTAIYVYLFVG